MKKTFSVINGRIKISKEKISDLKIYQRKLKIETEKKSTENEHSISTLRKNVKWLNVHNTGMSEEKEN